MLSKEDQRRFEQITRQLRESDPKFFARLDHRVRARRGRWLMLLTVILWASLPAMTVAGRTDGRRGVRVLVAANTGLMWRFRRRWR